MRHLFIILAIVGQTLSTEARAATWLYVAENVNGSVYYIDINSFRRVGSWISAWRKVDHSKNRLEKDREWKELWYVDCAGRRMALKSFTNYNANGTVRVSNSEPDYAIEWNEVVPDSVGESFFENVCKVEKLL